VIFLQAKAILVGHLAPDLDCLTAMWVLMRFGPQKDATLAFVPAGQTLAAGPVDQDPQIIHVDTGGGRFDHHQSAAASLSAAELVRRAVAPKDEVLRRMIGEVTRLDNAEQRASTSLFFQVNDLIAGYNALFPTEPQRVAQAMLPNFDAWYAQASRQLRLEQAFAQRLEFQTCWGLGIAMQSEDGASSRLAYGKGAVLFVYRDGRGYMGIAAQRQSKVNLQPVYAQLKQLDPTADWYLHPNQRLLLCGSAKAPPRQPSLLSLAELVNLLQNLWVE